MDVNPDQTLRTAIRAMDRGLPPTCLFESLSVLLHLYL